MPEVKCSVSNCEYWGQGNNCVAPAIMVEIDRHANATYNEEFANIGVETSHQDMATSSADTCCHTFKPRR
ncbi:DUF1540 domain-containing protein [Microaerobacter geothermalis]|uniref:DUF1540 domain-containing protein n=1 Tax=Microaerobacter geothermalis TaxID=674972 RepID=UPI001F1D46E0|nr:DUF1540 domain-containing protein [Microaerobacter geothermalis]MCF6095008.1 DUF1540 domain-containing protein [Microaerobacter geothermalis]